MFILYINDIPLSISDCNTDKYADDSTIHFSRKHISDIQTKVHEDLNRIELWCKDNNMFINCNTTKYMTIGTKQKLSRQNEELTLTINSEQLQHSACEKLLGIKIFSNPNWKNQIDQKDLRKNSSIKSKAESVVKKILVLDSDDSSSDIDTVDSSSSSDSDDYFVVSKKSKKHKSKNKKKSGIFYHPSDEVIKKQIWPQSKLQFEYADSKINFDELEFNLFVAGEL